MTAATTNAQASLDNFQATEPNHIELIDIGMLTPNPDQPRQHFDSNVITELAASLKELGFINPITVRKEDDGKIIIIAGEQRFRAAKQAGITMVPCIIKKADNAAEIALAENMLRQNLTAVEEAEALARLVVKGLSQKVLCQKFGKAASTISELIAIANLPESIKAQCRNNHDYARRELKKIATAPVDMQQAMLDAYKKKIASSIRAPNKTERSAAASLKTVIRSLEGRLKTFSQVERAEEKIEIAKELKHVSDSIVALLAYFDASKEEGA